MSKEKMLDDDTVREIREAQRERYEGMRKALWPLPTQSWEEHCAMRAAGCSEAGASAEDDEDESAPTDP